MWFSKRAISQPSTLFATDACLGVASLVLALESLALPSTPAGGYSLGAYDRVAGILFLPPSIAANHFCDQSIFANSTIEDTSGPQRSLNVTGDPELADQFYLAQGVTSNLVSR